MGCHQGSSFFGEAHVIMSGVVETLAMGGVASVLAHQYKSRGLDKTHQDQWSLVRAAYLTHLKAEFAPAEVLTFSDNELRAYDAKHLKATTDSLLGAAYASLWTYVKARRIQVIDQVIQNSAGLWDLFKSTKRKEHPKLSSPYHPNIEVFVCQEYCAWIKADNYEDLPGRIELLYELMMAPLSFPAGDPKLFKLSQSPSAFKSPFVGLLAEVCQFLEEYLQVFHQRQSAANVLEDLVNVGKLLFASSLPFVLYAIVRNPELPLDVPCLRRSLNFQETNFVLHCVYKLLCTPACLNLFKGANLVAVELSGLLDLLKEGWPEDSVFLVRDAQNHALMLEALEALDGLARTLEVLQGFKVVSRNGGDLLMCYAGPYIQEVLNQTEAINQQVWEAVRGLYRQSRQYLLQLSRRAKYGISESDVEYMLRLKQADIQGFTEKFEKFASVSLNLRNLTLFSRISEIQAELADSQHLMGGALPAGVSARATQRLPAVEPPTFESSDLSVHERDYFEVLWNQLVLLEMGTLQVFLQKSKLEAQLLGTILEVALSYFGLPHVHTNNPEFKIQEGLFYVCLRLVGHVQQTQGEPTKFQVQIPTTLMPAFEGCHWNGSGLEVYDW